MLFTYMHIRSGIGPQKDSTSNHVTDDQIIAIMLNKYFSSVFNTTSGGDNIDTNDTNTNDVTNNILVVSQGDTTEPSKNNNDNGNGSISNDNNENPNMLHLQNCIQKM